MHQTTSTGIRSNLIRLPQGNVPQYAGAVQKSEKQRIDDMTLARMDEVNLLGYTSLSRLDERVLAEQIAIQLSAVSDRARGAWVLSRFRNL